MVKRFKNYTPIDQTKANSMLITICFITIICCNILKFFGYKEFEIPLQDIDINIWVKRVVNSTLFIINGITFSLMFIKRKLTKHELFEIILLSFMDYIITYNIQSMIYILIDFIFYVYIGIMLKGSSYRFKDIIESVYIFIVILIFQVLSALYRNINVNFHIFDNFIVSIVLQIDYYMMIILLVINCFKKGGYLYERHWWKTFLVTISKRKRIKNCVEQSEISICEKQVDIGFKVFVVVLSIAQVTLVGTLCYFINNALLQYLIIFVSFVFMRKVYGNSYHSDTVLKCTTLAILIFVTATRVALPPWMSVLCNILIGMCIAYMMYVWYYYFEYTNKNAITLRKGMSETEFDAYFEGYSFTETELKRLKLKYVEKKTYKEIADIEYVEYDSIKKFFQRINKQLKIKE